MCLSLTILEIFLLLFLFFLIIEHKYMYVCMQVGYRHFDTAKIYGSEPALGNAINKAIYMGEVEREDIFLTSKLWGSDHHDPVAALKQTLK